MDVFRITGGARLAGSVAASGSKNAALPIMAAAILADGPVRLFGVPDLTDAHTLALVLEKLGVQPSWMPDGSLLLETIDSRPSRADDTLGRKMRASFCAPGPLLARRKRAVVPLPGGCAIGPRPVDLHLHGLAALGADVRVECGHVIATADRLRGAVVPLHGARGPTVTGTANVMSAATLAQGRTTIVGAAAEPEIVDLGRFLVAMGARISGLGTSTLIIDGVENLAGAAYPIIPDRIEAATLLMAGAITGGSVTVRGADVRHLEQVLTALYHAGAEIEVLPRSITVSGLGRPRPLKITARPFPGVPTDLQSQFMALLTLARGRSTISDRVFGERFGHVAELRRLGARIERRGCRALVSGVERLTGAAVVASDLRASAALVLAGLAAAGETVVYRVDHLDRGYERLEKKLASLGATIERVELGEHAGAPLRAAG